MVHKNAKSTLPNIIVTPIDLRGLQRELAEVDDFLMQANLRTPGEPIRMPKANRELDDIAKNYKLNILDKSDRQALKDEFSKIIKQAPVLHVSFATEPPPAFLQKLILWLRREIHPLILVQIGLQPSIAAGCTVRTANHYFDFSLRKRLVARRDVLIKRLREERAK